MQRRSSGLSLILTILVIILLLRTGIIFDIFFFILILILLIVGGIFIFSLSKNKKNTNKPTKEKETKDDPVIVKGLQSYFSDCKELYIKEDVSLLTSNIFYNSLSDLSLSYKGERIIKLKELQNDNYSLYETIYNKLTEYSKLSENQLKEMKGNLKEYNYRDVSRRIVDVNTLVGSIVEKPEVAEISIKDYYIEYILETINAVNYGDDNSKEYCLGHDKALDKYFDDIKKNKNTIETLEKLNNEIESIKDKTSIEDKGYYDGLFYILKTIKKANQIYIDLIK